MTAKVARFIGPAIVAAAGIAMCAWSWRGWPDPVIDFGREIYVPWRLAEGEVLYRDIVSYFNGPLSPYLHAALFWIFGASLWLLMGFNLIVVVLLAGMLYWLLAAIGGRFVATCGGVAFFVLFAFAQYLVTGNYNYVCPYSYELTHGITLTVAALVMLALWMRTDRAAWLAGSGALLGLVALTKAEIMLAAAAALAAGLLGELVARRAGARASLKLVGLFLGAATIPPLCAFALLCIALSPGDALRGMLGAWRFIGHRELTELPYFRRLAGTDDIEASIGTIVIWTIAYAVLVAPGVAAGIIARSPRAGRIAAMVLAGAVIGFGGVYWSLVNFNDLVRPAPLVLMVAMLVLGWRILRTRDRSLVLPLALVVWALVMLARMPLNAHIFHYGFALAMPATMLLIVILGEWLPRLAERRGRNGWPIRATVAAALAVVIFAHAHPLHMFYSTKEVVVGTGPDRFRADARGMGINRLLHHLSQRSEPGDTLVILPEGLLVNYLARMPNPTGQLNFTPPALIMYGEVAMLDAFRQNPPDWIAITSIDTGEYGPRFFGIDYALDLNHWIEANYRLAASTQSPPMFGMVLEINLLRRTASQSE